MDVNRNNREKMSGRAGRVASRTKDGTAGSSQQPPQRSTISAIPLGSRGAKVISPIARPQDVASSCRMADLIATRALDGGDGSFNVSSFLEDLDKEDSPEEETLVGDDSTIRTLDFHSSSPSDRSVLMSKNETKRKLSFDPSITGEVSGVRSVNRRLWEKLDLGGKLLVPGAMINDQAQAVEDRRRTTPPLPPPQETVDPLDEWINPDMLPTPVRVTTPTIRDREDFVMWNESESLPSPKTPCLFDICYPQLDLDEDISMHEYPPLESFETGCRLPGLYLHHLRKQVDPNFLDDDYWGDRYFFQNHPRKFDHDVDFPPEDPNLMDWQTTWRSLNAKADQVQVPTLKSTRENFRKAVYRCAMGADIEEFEKTFCEERQAGAKQLCFMKPKPGKAAIEALSITPGFPGQILGESEFMNFCSAAKFISGRVCARGLPLAPPHVNAYGNVVRYAMQPIVLRPTDQLTTDLNNPSTAKPDKRWSLPQERFVRFRTNKSLRAFSNTGHVIRANFKKRRSFVEGRAAHLTKEECRRDPRLNLRVDQHGKKGQFLAKPYGWGRFNQSRKTVQVKEAPWLNGQ